MLEPLIIQKTEDTPGITFDPENNIFVISDRSWPENAPVFYEPVFQWLDNYLQTPNPETVFEFKLEYFNTSSAKQIAKLLLLLEKYSKNCKITIRWHYDKEDIDMLTSGSRYAKLLNINYEFIEH
jgi:hypothetical protein